MSPEQIRQEAAVQLRTQPMVEVVRSMAGAGLDVQSILDGLVAFIGQPGYESVSPEAIAQAAIVAGLPAPAVVASLVLAVEVKLGEVGRAQLDAIIASAVAADVAVNGKAADAYAIAQAAADTGKISFAEASAIAGAAEADALAQRTSGPLEEIEPVISTR